MDIETEYAPSTSLQEQNNDDLLPIKLADWVKDANLMWVQAYMAADDTLKDKALLAYTHPDQFVYPAALNKTRDCEILYSFLARDASKSRLLTLDRLARYTAPNYATSPITVAANPEALFFEPNCGLGLLLSLLLDLTSTGEKILARCKEIETDGDNLKRALATFNNKQPPILQRLHTGKGIFPEIHSIIDGLTVLGGNGASFSKEPDGITKRQIGKLESFKVQDLKEIIGVHIDLIIDLHQRHESPLFLSNNGKPSLTLYRIRLLTYSLIEKTSIEAVQNMSGVYSLISYLVGLSLDHLLTSSELLTPSQVKRQVDTALELWQKHTPENPDRHNWRYYSHA